jgi:hypothetical protein
MRWYIDGILYHTVKATDMPADVWTNATNHGYFLVMDIAMGGGLADKTGGGPTAATKSGVPLLVDYFSVSSKPGSGTPTPTPTSTGPTGTGTATVPPGSTPTVTVTATVTSTVTVSATDCPPVPTTPPTTATTTSAPGGPGSPTNLRLAGSTASSLTLAWDGAAGASYDVLRSGVRIASVTGTTFTDIGLLPNTPYLYSIRGTTTTPQQTFTIAR